ncbi:MAG: hypothetical protein Salg2KO_10870 [Salibacteraceae bacterium]
MILEERTDSLILKEIQQLAQIGIWRVDVETSEIYWSDIVYDIHEEKPGKQMNI